MNTLSELLVTARNKSYFDSLEAYVTFACAYLTYIETNLQAEIVAQNEKQYRFFQYSEEGHFNITRPINADLFYRAAQSTLLQNEFVTAIRDSSAGTSDVPDRLLIQCGIYTIQQCIGATLDALPVGESNSARKLNGDLFENLIRLLLRAARVRAETGTVQVPVIVDGVEQFRMAYQQDLLLYAGDNLKVIGSMKTSSKDRLSKIFLDKFLYSRLTDTTLPHIAVFLNDVQRKATRLPNEYAINGTFLSGHFKAFTVKLNPLDGVYYCDPHPIMERDSLLRDHIKAIDSLFCDDLPHLLAEPAALPSGTVVDTSGDV